MARITKIELLQSNERLMAENSALRTENFQLRTQAEVYTIQLAEARNPQPAAPSAQPQPEVVKRPKLVVDSNWTLPQLAQHFATHYHCSTKIANGSVFYKTKKMATWKQVNLH